MVVATRYSGQPSWGTGRGPEEVRMREESNGFQTSMRDDKGYAIQTRRGYMLSAPPAHRWTRAHDHQGLPWATEDSLRAHWDQVAPSASNRSHVRAALAAFFEFVNAAGWRPDNPALKLPRPKQPKRMPRPIPQGDTKKLLD